MRTDIVLVAHWSLCPLPSPWPKLLGCLYCHVLCAGASTAALSSVLPLRAPSSVPAPLCAKASAVYPVLHAGADTSCLVLDLEPVLHPLFSMPELLLLSPLRVPCGSCNPGLKRTLATEALVLAWDMQQELELEPILQLPCVLGCLDPAQDRRQIRCLF